MSEYYHKICTIWCYEPKYDNVRADMFGRGWSPTGWPGGQNHNSWGRNSSGLVQREPDKGERWTRMPLLPDSVSNTSQMPGSRAHWPQGHIPDILPRQWVWWVYRGQMSSSQPVWQKSGCQRPNRESFDIIVLSHFQTCCGLNSGESLCMSPCEAHPSKSRQTFI